jgi:hypothetical protein
VRQYQAEGTVAKRKGKKPALASVNLRSPEERLRLLFLIRSLPDDERGEVMRREGVHDADLDHWEREAVAGLRSEETPAQQQRTRQLERESCPSQEAPERS